MTDTKGNRGLVCHGTPLSMVCHKSQITFRSLPKNTSPAHGASVPTHLHNYRNSTLICLKKRNRTEVQPRRRQNYISDMCVLAVAVTGQICVRSRGPAGNGITRRQSVRLALRHIIRGETSFALWWVGDVPNGEKVKPQPLRLR
jgi:hypothetical protein